MLDWLLSTALVGEAKRVNDIATCTVSMLKQTEHVCMALIVDDICTNLHINILIYSYISKQYHHESM